MVLTMQVVIFLTALIVIVGNMNAQPVSHPLRGGMWKRARTPPQHSPAHSSNSVEVYSPVRSTSHIYDDAYYDPFPSNHDQMQWTPPSSPIPDKPASPLKSHDPAEIVASKSKRKYTRKSTLKQNKTFKDKDTSLLPKSGLNKEGIQTNKEKKARMTPFKLRKAEEFKRYEELTNKPTDQLKSADHEYIRNYETKSSRRFKQRKYYVKHADRIKEKLRIAKENKNRNSQQQ